MGQYYKCVTKGKKKTTVWGLQTKQWAKKKAKANGAWVDGYNGVKLMEHSWIGNAFMDGISKHIYKKPMRVAWVGDYADSVDGYFGEDEKISARKLHKIAWQTIRKECLMQAPRKFEYKGKYLVNHTQKVAIDLGEYIERYTTDDGWCVHPLSLLTACGNGLGGGDYGSCYQNSDLVGIWCWDVISIEDEAPKDCEKIMIGFMEY